MVSATKFAFSFATLLLKFARLLLAKKLHAK
ncbi:hypothetical protein EBCG_01577 [Escherichia marmotae]|nr:hypothetical protein EBCG_01577 [Escherichia marmotae]